MIPVSSTVIPIISYQLNSTGGASAHHSLSLNDEYRIAYLNHMRNKTKKQNQDEPDTLITRMFIVLLIDFYFVIAIISIWHYLVANLNRISDQIVLMQNISRT